VPRSLIATSSTSSSAVDRPTPRCSAILDLCTGSGCIAIAAARALPAGTRWMGADISARAGGGAHQRRAARSRRARAACAVRPVSGTRRRRYDLILTNPRTWMPTDMAAPPTSTATNPALRSLSGEQGLDAILAFWRTPRHT